MKKVLYLILFTPLVFLQSTFAQQSFSDAEVTYSVKVDPSQGASTASNSNVDGSTLIYQFKNYLFRSEMQIGQTTYTNIHDSRNKSAVVLIHSGANNYLIKMNEAQLRQEDKRFEGIIFTEVPGETEKIAGYTCKKAVGKLQDGSSFIVFYTPDLVPENDDYSERFKGLKGLPLKFITTSSKNMKMTMTATKVTIAPQASALFATPTSGYRLLTYDELQSMRSKR